MRRVGVTFALVVAGVLAWVLLAPQQLGGPIAVVSTFGDSMQPVYEPHHLVVVRRERAYEVGDIVAYDSDQLDTVVLHRIVEVEDGRFVTQGDNNAWLDPDRPDAGDVIGRVWVAVPQLGRVLELPAGARIALLAAAVLAIAGPAAARRAGGRPQRGRPQRGQPRKAGRSRPADAAGDSGRRVTWAGRAGQLALAGGALIVVGATGAAVASSSPATQPGDVPVEQRHAFTYQAPAPTGAVYPDGSVDPGEPIFLRLVDRVGIDYAWTLDSDAADNIKGEGQLFARIEDGSGWQQTVPLGSRSSWSGTEGQISGELDFVQLRRLAGQVAAATGVAGANQTVTVIAETSVAGGIGGSPWNSTSGSEFSLRVDELRATLATPPAAEDAANPLVVTETSTVTVPGNAPYQLSVARWEVPTTTARIWSLAILAVGIALAAAAGFAAHRSRSWNEHQRIAARFGHAIVDVTALSAAGDRAVVSVTTFEQLADLADQQGLPILRVPLATVGHGYVVDDATARYRYRPRDANTTHKATVQSAPPPPPTASPPTDHDTPPLFPMPARNP